jgi:CheY-like chemotaxis protein
MDRTARRILIVDDEAAAAPHDEPVPGPAGIHRDRRRTPPTRLGRWWKPTLRPSTLAVLDGSMDGMSMEELASRMLNANPSLCILTASGYPVDMTALSAKAPGRVAFLLKPFTPQSLAAAVGGLLAAQEKEL